MTVPDGPPTLGPGEILARVVRHLEARLRLGVVLWTAAGVGLVLALAWLLAGASGWPGRSWGPVLLDLAALGIVLGGLALLLGLRRTWLQEGRVASAVDASAGLPDGTLMGVTELERRLPPGVSAGLARSAREGVTARLSVPPARLAGELETGVRRWIRRGAGAVSVLAVTLAGFVLAAPDRSRAAWGGLLDPVGLLRGPALEPLSVEPGNARVPRGEGLEVRIGAPGRGTVELEWRTVGDVPRARTLAVSEGAARHTFREVSAAMEYRVRAPDGAVTPEFRVEPVDPFFVSGLTLEVSFPPHTRRVPEEYRGEAPPLTLPVGARIRIRGRSSRPLSGAALEGEVEDAGVELEVDGARFSGEWVPRRSGSYRWRVVGTEGEDPRELPPPLELTLVGDSAPEVTVVFPGRDTVLPLSLRQSLVLEARDDYGIRYLELEARRMGPPGAEEEPLTRRMDGGEGTTVVARPVLTVAGWELLPGDSIRYRARAVDNAPTPSVAETPWYILRVPLRGELEREASRSLEDAAEAVEELARRVAEAQEATRELERAAGGQRDPGAAVPETRGSRARPDAGPPEPLDFREREEIQQALERQEGLVESADSLGGALEELARELRDAGAPDPDLRRQLAELQDLMREAASPELRERLREMMESLDGMELARARAGLQAMASDQEAFRERLRESLERFRRAAVQQELRATSSEAGELARREELLAEAFREGDDLAATAEAQEALEARTRDLQARMDSLGERLEGMGEREASEEARASGERARSASRSMERAAAEARRSRSGEAGEEADRAAGDLSRTSEELEEAAREMARGWQEEGQGVLRRTVNDALGLARRQAELDMDPRRDGPPAAREDLRGDQGAVLQGARKLAEGLTSLGQVAPELERRLSAELGQAMREMELLMDPSTSGAGGAPASGADGQGAVRGLNRVALAAAAAASRAGQPQEQGEGGRSMQEQLEALAREQGELAGQSGSLVPLQLGQEAMARQLQRLSGGQEAVADELGELARRQREGRGEGALGDLEALREEAMALARALAGDRIAAETVRRQERLFHRLLDAGRSLEMEERSQERESTVGAAVPPRDVPELDAEALGIPRFPLPGSEELRSLTPAQRALVLDYFRRLNRGGGR